MSKLAPAFLPDRAVIRLAGEDARAFLNGLVTNEMSGEAPSAFAALLTPQGKVLCDMIVHAHEDALYLDIPAPAAEDLIKRLTMYRLRRKIEISDESETLGVLIGGDAPPDPRHADLPARSIAGRGVPTADDGYNAARIALGAPELFKDYTPSELFPADVDMDWLNGVNLKKGCFVGQEVVSRMHRRGTIRKRMLPARIDGGALDFGTEITAGGKPVGTVRSSLGEAAIVLVRTDRVEKAEGPLEAAGRAVELLRTDAP